MAINKFLIGRKANISEDTDNENYDRFLGRDLIITHASNGGLGYDDGMYPKALCNFTCADGSDFPFALYEYEFDLL